MKEALHYRPFRLIWWVLATIMIYTAIFVKKIPGRVNAYIANLDLNSTGEEKKEVQLSLWETLLNCAYFSVMLFFTFRLKRDILTFFDAKEKRLIVGEWVVGFLVYVAFLTLSKSGSILHNLKELFVISEVGFAGKSDFTLSQLITRPHGAHNRLGYQLGSYGANRHQLGRFISRGQSKNHVAVERRVRRANRAR